MNTHITVAKTVDGKLAAVDDRHQSSVTVSQGIERSIVLFAAPDCLTHSHGFLGQRALHMYGRQRRQMPIRGFAAHFGAPVKICQSATQRAPLFYYLRLALRSTINPKVFRLVDR